MDDFSKLQSDIAGIITMVKTRNAAIDDLKNQVATLQSQITDLQQASPVSNQPAIDALDAQLKDMLDADTATAAASTGTSDSTNTAATVTDPASAAAVAASSGASASADPTADPLSDSNTAAASTAAPAI